MRTGKNPLRTSAKGSQQFQKQLTRLRCVTSSTQRMPVQAPGDRPCAVLVRRWHVAARTMTLSLGDSLILAVTERLGCQIVTIDRHWTFLADKGLLPVTINQL
jgi:PIN domain nuclease of toxin-antitoxin system